MSKKILFVDDEPDFITIMGERIRNWGYELIEALSGQEAIEIVKNKQVDIIILDYLMPDMDGIDTLKEIRKFSEIPVIMFTVYPDMKTIKGTEKLNVSAFIPKLSAYADTQVALKTAIDMVEKKINGK